MLTSTNNVDTQYIKVIVHAPAGAGKTRLCATVESPLIISAEGGLLSLREHNLPAYVIKSMDDMKGAYQEAMKPEYKWICIDSISEIAEILLADLKSKKADARQAYGEMNDTMVAMVRSFRDLDKHIYMTAKQDKVKDEVTGAMLYSPGAPGKQLSQALPYLFDEVFALQTWKDEQGVMQRALQTQRDNQYDAKDRSGALAFAEPADLGFIQNKILTPSHKE